MGDHSTERLHHLQNHQNNEKIIRDDFLGENLYLTLDSLPLILNHTDCFVSQSRGNESIQHLHLYPYSVYGQDYEVWDKVGQAIGNL
jgi:hypothetical protein